VWVKEKLRRIRSSKSVEVKMMLCSPAISCEGLRNIFICGFSHRRICIAEHVGVLSHSTNGQRHEAWHTASTRRRDTTIPSGCPQLPWRPLYCKIDQAWRSTPWPPTSPDLTHLYFTLYAFLKGYSVCPSDAERCWRVADPDFIKHACGRRNLGRTCAELQYLWDVCCVKKEAHIGHVQNCVK
jgi:hypothetical protein